mmetsp:Transcript_29834/g.65212  ORF Transcript_29834/g.65212 Transcript_29834/m.65212 type:complete len:884 (-) Transcript_29834:338-2989(-)
MQPLTVVRAESEALGGKGWNKIMEMHPEKLPKSFICPITGEVFSDPVMTMDGHTYERAAITRWLQTNDTSPLTHEPLSLEGMQTNVALKTLLNEWGVRQAANASSLEIPFEELELGIRELGEGSFKCVQEGRWKGKKVAVATFKNIESFGIRAATLKEASVMRALGQHPYIITFHGVSTDSSGREHLVTELASQGSLLEVLSKAEDHGMDHIPVGTLLVIAQQVCEAMQAISHSEVVHRDLALRNVLVSDPLDFDKPSTVNVKVSDFGLSREQHFLRSRSTGCGDGLPVRYMSPEAIQRNKFSEKSDVWAFGVLLWEAATLGMIPYDSLGVFVANDAEVKQGVCAGTLRLPQPPHVDKEVYELMTACWAKAPADRPTFRVLRWRIQQVTVRVELSSLMSRELIAPPQPQPPGGGASPAGRGSPAPSEGRAASRGSSSEEEAEDPPRPPDRQGSPSTPKQRLQGIWLQNPIAEHPRLKRPQGGFAKCLSCTERPARDAAGNTALHHAAREWHESCIAALIEEGVDINAQNEEGRTPLTCAAQEGHVEVVKLLMLDPRVDINRPMTSGATPLYKAALGGHLEVVAQLMQHPKLNVNSLRRAEGGAAGGMGAGGIFSTLKELSEHMAGAPEDKPEEGFTPLFIAAQEGHADIVRKLLTHPQLDVNRAEENGITPLNMAAQQGHLEVVVALLEDARAHVNQPTKDGCTPLYIAAQQGHVEVVRTLMLGSRNGPVDVNAAMKNGVTPIYMASQKGHGEVVRLLMRHPRININAADWRGFTPLYIAAAEGHLKVVQQLMLHQHVDVNTVPMVLNGGTTLFMAVQGGHFEIVSLLCSHPDIDVNKAEENGETPLDAAMRKGYRSIEKLLMQHGARDSWTGLISRKLWGTD